MHVINTHFGSQYWSNLRLMTSLALLIDGSHALTHFKLFDPLNPAYARLELVNGAT
jgi:hypothetical protein